MLQQHIISSAVKFRDGAEGCVERRLTRPRQSSLGGKYCPNLVLQFPAYSIGTKMSIRFSTFPRTRPPPGFLAGLVARFEEHAGEIGTPYLEKGLTSDEVLAVLRPDLIDLGFEVEASKQIGDKIRRPVFFGENAQPELQYEVDAWHPEWLAGLEIEAGRAWMGNAIYRDLIQALVIVDMDHLILAVPQGYRYKSGGRVTASRDYDNTVAVAQALYAHSRVEMPFSLCVIGY